MNPPVRLTQAEYDRLAVFLLGSGEDAFEMPLLSTVDGLLTAVAICPEPIPETEWLDVILGAERPNFKSDDEAGEIVGLLRRMCLEIREALAADPPTFEPLLEIDVDGSLLGEIWGEGFGAGVELRPNIFLPLAEHPAGARCMGPLLVLSVPQMADMLESNRRKRQRLLRSYSEAIDICAAAAYRVARMSEDERASALARLDEELLEEASESAKKVGRNEPCPCGSGKKFKRCCGADA